MYLSFKHNQIEVKLDKDKLCLNLKKPISLEEGIQRLKETDGKKFFDPAQQEVFPEKDFFLSTQVDKFNFVLRYCTDEPCGYVQKIEI